MDRNLPVLKAPVSSNILSSQTTATPRLHVEMYIEEIKRHDNDHKTKYQIPTQIKIHFSLGHGGVLPFSVALHEKQKQRLFRALHPSHNATFVMDDEVKHSA